MGVIRPRDQEIIKALTCASALKTLLMTTDCGSECFTVKISSQQAKHLAVLRLTVNATENLTKARVQHEKKNTSKIYQEFKIAHLLWLTFFTTNSQILNLFFRSSG